MAEARRIEAHPGPQTQFLATPADIAIYGGAAGGGKSWGIVYDPLRWVHLRGFSAAYFRRTTGEMRGPGGLWELSHELYPSFGARPYEQSMRWRFPSGATIGMHHLQHEKDKFSHQGKQYCCIYFDELSHFSESQFWYLYSRNRSLCGVSPYIRGTTNPDPDSFVAKLVEWWIDQDKGTPIPERSGVLRWFYREQNELIWIDRPEQATYGAKPTSFTFISASLEDNPTLMEKDPGYVGRLMALPIVDRERLLRSNWKVRPAAGMYFKRHWFPTFDEIPGQIVKSVRAWDKAASEPTIENPDPDWTRGVLMHELRDAPVKYIIADIVGDRCGPGSVDRMMKNTATRDGLDVPIAIWIDPGQAGLVDLKHVRTVLDGFKVMPERASKSKLVYAGPVSSAVENGMIGLLKGPWNASFLAEAEQFPEGGHDDQVDTLSLAHRRIRGVPLPSNAGGHSQVSRHRVG